MLSAALPFLLTADRLKRVNRQNSLHDGSRPENAAEHAWHAALTALVLAEHAPPGTDMRHVVNLLLVHELGHTGIGDRMNKPGNGHWLSSLPALCAEFEAGTTPEATFARHLDTLTGWRDGMRGPAVLEGSRHTEHDVTHPERPAAVHAWRERGGASAERLTRQLAFLNECGRLKGVRRTTYLHDGSRPENSAEHSWHLALMALLGGLPPGADRAHVIRLLLVHDLVEIHAGDTHFDAPPEALARQADQEAQAARALFGRLPDDQAASLQGLWEEFEAQRTPDARYARALDALQPMLLTWGPGGRGCTDRHPELTAERLLALKRPRLEAYPDLWALAQQIVSDAVRAGLLPAAPVTAGMKLRLSP